jgi:periplasmic divalent cation tolerance protein
LSTAGNMDEGSKIAERLVRERLVACVNLLPGIQSVYWWNNAVQKEQEVLMIIKTERDQFQEVQRLIVSLHSYEVPEVISLALEDGFKDYLNWIENSIRK